MKEKVLSKRKNGMAALLITVVLYLAAVFGVIGGGITLDNG